MGMKEASYCDSSGSICLFIVYILIMHKKSPNFRSSPLRGQRSSARTLTNGYRDSTPLLPRASVRAVVPSSGLARKARERRRSQCGRSTRIRKNRLKKNLSVAERTPLQTRVRRTPRRLERKPPEPGESAESGARTKKNTASLESIPGQRCSFLQGTTL